MRSKNNSNTEYRICLLITMIVFGTVGIVRRYLPLSSATVAFFRSLIGTLFLLLVVKIRKIKLDFGKIGKSILPLLISGICLGFNWVLLFEAYNYTSVAVATLCYYFSPAIVILASPFVFKEKINFRKILCLLGLVAGTALISGVASEQTLDGELNGVLLALGAACFYAALTMINKKLENAGTYERTVIQLATACVLLLPYCVCTHGMSNIKLTLSSVILITILGVFHTGIAYMAYFTSISHVNAQTVALYSYVDPVCSVLCSALLLGEGMTARLLVGTVVILLSSYFSEKT